MKTKIYFLILITGIFISCSTLKTFEPKLSLDLLPSIEAEQIIYDQINSLDFYVDINNEDELPIGKVGKFPHPELDTCMIYAYCTTHYISIGKDSLGRRVTEIHHTDFGINIYDVYALFPYQIKRFEKKSLGRSIMRKECEYITDVYRFVDGKFVSLNGNLVLYIDEEEMKCPLYVINERYYLSQDEKLIEMYNQSLERCRETLLHLSRRLLF